MTSAPPAYDTPPLPTFLPSTEAIDAAAAKLCEINGLEGKLEDLPAVVKSNVRSMVLALFTAAGDELVVSALAHVTSNHTAYGFTDEQRDDLIFATFATDHGAMSLSEDDATVD